MGKVFKSAKKIVKKAAPVIGAAAGFALAGPAGLTVAQGMGIGAGLGGLAGGYGVKNSLMMGMGGYGLGSLAHGASMFGLKNVMADPTLLTGGKSFFGIPSLLKRGATSAMNFLSGRKGIPAQTGQDVFGPNWPGTPPYVPRTTPGKDTSQVPLLKGLFNKLNSPLGVLGATTALGYLGAKGQKAGDPVEEAKRMMTQYQSPTDIKYGTKFSSAPGQKVKGLFWNPSTLQYQDQPYIAQSAQGGIINALARGGQPMSIQDFPRKQGHISGPGTATSDSVPALLSDGEFVMTADAVKGIGNGSRRDGAKKMYNLMNQFERRAVA